MLRRTGERTVRKTGTCTVTVTYGITSVPPAEADAALLERLWRAHWTMENRVHYPRDLSWREDRYHGRAIGPILAWARNLDLTRMRTKRSAGSLGG